MMEIIGLEPPAVPILQHNLMQPQCCPDDSHPYLQAPKEHNYAGNVTSIQGVNTYLLKGNSTAIVVIADVWGEHTGLHRYIADKLHRDTGFTVAVPDLFHGAAPFTELRSYEEQAQEAFGTLFAKFLYHQVAPDLLEKVFPTLRNTMGVNKIGVLGFCYGGYVMSKLLETGEIQAGASAHAAVWAIMNGAKEDPVALYSRSKCPVMLLNAGNDPAEQGPGGSLQLALPQSVSKDSVFESFPDMVHGWTIRGEATENTVRDRKKAMELFVGFFTKVLNE
jgi:dienelactone hydrolase